MNFEISICRFCNFSCKHCGHFSKYHNGTYKPNDFIRWIDLIAKKFPKFFNYLIISGGEPTLHPDVVNFVSEIRRHWSPLMLWSNGWWLNDYENYETLLSQIDKLHISIHPELTISIQDVGKILNEIKYKYNIETEFNPVSIDFNEIRFSDNPRSKKCVHHTKPCFMLLPNGKVGRCSMLSYCPNNLATEGFNKYRRYSLFDVEAGSLEELSQWVSSSPIACDYCDHHMKKSKQEVD